MKTRLTVASLIALCLCSPATAQEKPTVAMIGTGNLGGMLGPVIAGLGPDRRIVQIDPLAVSWSGGGMHCIVQQQPRVQ